jgi:DNA-binding response OmpR family regulator
LLKGRKILIVEDEPLIALDLETAVRDHNGVPLGPVGTMAEAEVLLQSEWPAGAIVDLGVKDGHATEFAGVLRRSGVTVVIHSGQADTSLPPDWPSHLIVAKPALPETVIAALASAMFPSA